MKPFNLIARLRQLGAMLLLALPLMSGAADQQTFATPEAAVEALITALKSDNDAALLSIFGEDQKDLVIHADRAEASATRANILAAMQTLHVLHETGKERRLLLIGAEAWPVPIPIVRVGERWRFASEEGADELINRRIGANERNAIYVLRAYLDAQRAYAARDRDDDGVREYATKIASTPGKQDGLYWPADETKGEEASPFGPLIAESAAYLKGHAVGDAYRGYHFKVLTRQGKAAPGGAHNYIINGNMIAGCALLAYPAEYAASGVMSFIVSHNGKVYQKDLGASTVRAAEKISAFNPGAGWQEVVAP